MGRWVSGKVIIVHDVRVEFLHQYFYDSAENIRKVRISVSGIYCVIGF